MKVIKLTEKQNKLDLYNLYKELRMSYPLLMPDNVYVSLEDLGRYKGMVFNWAGWNQLAMEDRQEARVKSWMKQKPNDLLSMALKPGYIVVRM